MFYDHGFIGADMFDDDIADQLYGDEEMWETIKDEVTPALERWTDLIFDGEHTLMDFWAPYLFKESSFLNT